MINNLQGELILMNSMGIKPNYAKLAEKYGMDWRTGLSTLFYTIIIRSF